MSSDIALGAGLCPHMKNHRLGRWIFIFIYTISFLDKIKKKLCEMNFYKHISLQPLFYDSFDCRRNKKISGGEKIRKSLPLVPNPFDTYNVVVLISYIPWKYVLAPSCFSIGP